MTPVTTDLSLLTLVAQASIVVKIVLAILILLSLLSWTVIFRKFSIVQKAQKSQQAFESQFWSGTDLLTLQNQVKEQGSNAGLQAQVFHAGITEFLKQQKIHPAQATTAATRAMRAVFNRGLDELESGLPLLASIGSTAPYIGLFGTVWGIMNAFTGLSSLENVSLAVVAPGIAEALIATAIGLFAAIPAVAAYNYYNNRIQQLSNRIDSFHEEFLNILDRQVRGS